MGKKDENPLPVNKKNPTQTTLTVLPRKLDKFPMGPREKEIKDLFLTSIHLVTLQSKRGLFWPESQVHNLDILIIQLEVRTSSPSQLNCS